MATEICFYAKPRYNKSKGMKYFNIPKAIAGLVQQDRQTIVKLEQV